MASRSAKLLGHLPSSNGKPNTIVELPTLAEQARQRMPAEDMPPELKDDSDDDGHGNAWEPPEDRLGPPPNDKNPDSQAKAEVLSNVYERFPVDCFPEPARTFTIETAAALGCDVGYVAPHVLAVIAGLIGNKVRIALKRSWKEPPVVWSVAIGESGTLKSPAWQAVVAVLYRLQEELFRRYEKELEQYEHDLAEWKDADKGERGDKPRPPRKRRLICSDVTVEKIAVVLEDNPSGVLQARDELSAVLTGFNQYKPKGGSDVASYLEMHRAGPILVDRKGPAGQGVKFYVPRAAVSICGGIQPAVFAKLMNDQFRASGLMARLLITMPPRKVKRWTEADVDDSTIAAFSNLLQYLASMPTYAEPIVVSLSPEAKALWVDFYNSWNTDNAEATGDAAAMFSKLEGYAARFALIYQVILTCRDTAPTPISAESMTAGIALARWFAKEAERVYAVMEETRGEAQTAELLGFIRSRPGTRVTPRDVHRWKTAQYPSCDAAEKALHKLDHRGRWATGAVGPEGGRPPLWFILNDK